MTVHRDCFQIEYFASVSRRSRMGRTLTIRVRFAGESSLFASLIVLVGLFWFVLFNLRVQRPAADFDP